MPAPAGRLVKPLRVIDNREERLFLGRFGQQAEERQSDEERIGRRARRLTNQAEGDAERLVLGPR